MDKHDKQAIDILSNGHLSTAFEGIDNKKLLLMFRCAQRYKQANLGDDKERQRADAVVESCIRVIRCLYLSPNAHIKIFPNSHSQTLDPHHQFEKAQENYAEGFNL